MFTLDNLNVACGEMREREHGDKEVNVKNTLDLCIKRILSIFLLYVIIGANNLKFNGYFNETILIKIL